ncbi:hypothetical protein LXL04_028210 [Taraxacum kok-saghyz]
MVEERYPRLLRNRSCRLAFSRRFSAPVLPSNRRLTRLRRSPLLLSPFLSQSRTGPISNSLLMKLRFFMKFDFDLSSDYMPVQIYKNAHQLFDEMQSMINKLNVVPVQQLLANTLYLHNYIRYLIKHTNLSQFNPKLQARVRCIRFWYIITICHSLHSIEKHARKYVGIPGMNSICRALCHEPGIESKFGVMVGRLEWLENEESWTLADVNGQDLGKFNGVVASDKSTFSQRFTQVTGKPPPLDLKVIPGLADMIEEVPVRPCFALMLAFENPLSSIPLKGFSIDNSQLLSWATCDSSKPGRSTSSERWVLRSTEEYAQGIIGRAGLQKPSNAALSEIVDELFQEFQRTGLDISLPFFKKAHRWGSAFPAISTTKDEKCIWDKRKKLAICGDFCVSPDVEGAIASGLAAASMFSQSSNNFARNQGALFFSYVPNPAAVTNYKHKPEARHNSINRCSHIDAINIITPSAHEIEFIHLCRL